MTTLTRTLLPVGPSARAPAAPGQQVVLRAVPWPAYEAIGEALRDQAGVRLTYDRGRLQIMTLSPEHEILKKLLGRFVEVLAEELRLPLATAGQMTMQRADLERGLEPDDCFWVAHEAQMRGRTDWSDRMATYAALGVPEVWRCDGANLTVHRLQAGHTYQTVPGSATFPGVPMDGIAAFLQPTTATDYLGTVAAFRAWVRQQLAGAAPSPPTP